MDKTAMWRRIINTTWGKMFTVTFFKRTTGEKRVLNGRIDVKKGIKGTGPTVDWKANDLIPVYDMQKAGWRSINLREVLEVKAGGYVYYLNDDGLEILCKTKEGTQVHLLAVLIIREGDLAGLQKWEIVHVKWSDAGDSVVIKDVIYAATKEEAEEQARERGIILRGDCYLRKAGSSILESKTIKEQVNENPETA